MSKLLTNIRFYILLCSGILSVVASLYVKSHYPGQTLQTIRLTQVYAFIAVSFLYLAILATPLTRVLTGLPFRAQYIYARRAIGVSAFYFAFLHGFTAFFSQLGGFSGLPFLPDKYLLAISLSFTAFCILTLMAVTSFDYLIEKVGYTRWKMLHRLVYLASVLILIHALMLGTHFITLSALIPKMSLTAVGVLLLLESIRVDRYLNGKYLSLRNLPLISSLTCLLVGGYLTLVYSPLGQNSDLSFGIHAGHIQQAIEAQKGNLPGGLYNSPALQGDPTRRFTVSFNPPLNVIPSKEVSLNFSVNDASSGNQVLLYSRVYEKLAHLVIIDDKLDFFNHIHPEQKDSGFVINTSFPHPGRYHLYLDFQPLGAIEQQFGFTIDVGQTGQTEVSEKTVDTNTTKQFDNYFVSLDYQKPLLSSEISVGQNRLTFNIADINNNPVTTLKPYLGAFGHLVMINTQTYDYIHVHPSNLIAPPPDASGGPSVEFIPLGLYGPIKPGIYRVFGQFNPDGKLFTADFTIEVQ